MKHKFGGIKFIFEEKLRNHKLFQVLDSSGARVLFSETAGGRAGPNFSPQNAARVERRAPLPPRRPVFAKQPPAAEENSRRRRMDLSDSVRCPVCFCVPNTATNPPQMVCKFGHRMCKRCTDQVMMNGKRECPIGRCRIEAPFPIKDILMAEIINNFDLSDEDPQQPPIETVPAAVPAAAVPVAAVPAPIRRPPPNFEELPFDSLTVQQSRSRITQTIRQSLASAERTERAERARERGRPLTQTARLRAIRKFEKLNRDLDNHESKFGKFVPRMDQSKIHAFNQHSIKFGGPFFVHGIGRIGTAIRRGEELAPTSTSPWVATGSRQLST